MGETVHYIRRQRARSFCFFRTFIENFRFGKSPNCGRQNDIFAGMDLQLGVFARCLAGKRIADVRRFLHFVMAFPDVAFVSQTNLHQSLNEKFQFRRTANIKK